MQIEVTEKEAMEIYSQRYIRQHRKKPLMVLGISVLVTFVAYGFAVAHINDWLALLAVILMSPALYMSIRFSQTSGKYARSQIEEIK